MSLKLKIETIEYKNSSCDSILYQCTRKELQKRTAEKTSRKKLQKRIAIVIFILIGRNSGWVFAMVPGTSPALPSCLAFLPCLHDLPLLEIL